jgi:hypothetical protein
MCKSRDNLEGYKTLVTGLECRMYLNFQLNVYIFKCIDFFLLAILIFKTSMKNRNTSTSTEVEFVAS